MYREDLVKQWLWMQAMAYALEQILWLCKLSAVPSENDRLHQPWSETCGKTYKYALDNWSKVASKLTQSSGGKYSGDGRYYLGYHNEIRGQIVRAKYRTTEVTISFPEVKHFIEHMLQAPEMAERQMTLLDLLAEQAPQNL